MPAYHYQQGDRPLDGYTIQYALGRGGFGEVYFATSDAGREVALKSVLNYQDIELRGIGHCMNLKSPHLVMIFDVKQGDDGTPWVIMEYVAGSSLRDILDAHAEGLSHAQAAFLIRELAKGIDYLHAAGIVHRDLKPHNVFFEDGLVKIGDYSLSKVISLSHASGHTMTVGSVHYMAPEISLGKYDRTVDLYALGVMLYEMLTGAPPYVGESVGEVLMKHLNNDVDVSDLPEPFAAVVRKAMHRDPSQRYQSAREMAEALTTQIQAAVEESIPASLSMVGRRRGSPTALSVQGPASLVSSQLSLVDTVDAPRATGDTAESQPQENSPREDADRLDSGADLTENTDGTALDFVLRLVLSLVSTLILMVLAFGISLEPWPAYPVAEFVAIAFGLWVLALALATWTVRSAKIANAICRESNILSHLLSRMGMVVFWAISLAVALGLGIHNLFVQPLNQLLGYGVGAAVTATLFLDWRIFVSARRERVLLPHTLAAGAISGVVAGAALQSMAAVVIAMSVSMSFAITTSLISKWSKSRDDDAGHNGSISMSRESAQDLKVGQGSDFKKQSELKLENVAW